MSDTPIPTIALSGYYGCGNLGDEAILAGICAGFARLAGDRVRLVALSENPQETERLHQIAAFPRRRGKAPQIPPERFGLLLSGGGSLLQDKTSLLSLLFYLQVCRQAKRRGIPYMFYAQGMGPLTRRISQMAVRWVANSAAYITVRDQDSAQLLKEIGVSRPPIEVTADPAFALEPAPAEAIDALCAAEQIPQGKALIGLALRSWSGDTYADAERCANLLKSLRKRTEAALVLLPMHAQEDLGFAEEVLRLAPAVTETYLIRRSYAPDVTLGFVSRMDAMVAMRLHALIFAARVATPPVALSYDPKVTSLMRELGLESWSSHCDAFDPESVADRATRALESRETLQTHLRAQAPERERRPLQNVERALNLLSAW